MLNIGLFKKPYLIRRYSAQILANGYPVTSHTDVQTRLNVQPLGVNELAALPEGMRTVKRLKTFGKDRLTAADDLAGVPGDRLWYDGLWFECTASVLRERTPLGHYRSEFVMLPDQAPPPLTEPSEGGQSP